MAKKKAIKRQYRARRGAPISDEEAVIIGSRLETLSIITRETVLNDARNPKSPLHRFIQWDNRKAAESWRLEQAQHLINYVHIVVTIDKKEYEVGAFHRLVVERDDGEDEPTEISYYKPVLELTEEEMSQRVLKDALTELIAWRNRYVGLMKLCKALFGEIDRAIEQIEMELQPDA